MVKNLISKTTVKNIFSSIKKSINRYRYSTAEWHQKRIDIAKKHYESGHFNSYWDREIQTWHKVKSHPEKLRLILGVGRSGTTWIVNTLAQTKTPICCYEEPLYAINPPLVLSRYYDYTAIGYSRESNGDLERLLYAYQILCSDCESIFFEDMKKKKTLRNDNNCKYYLIKEVHALMATEFLVKNLSCPVLLIQREIITLIDSIMDHTGIELNYFRSEFESLQETKFLEDFFPHKMEIIVDIIGEIEQETDARKKSIYMKALVAYLFQEMFEIINIKYGNVMLVKYDDLIKDRDEYFSKISKFFKFEYQENSFNLKTARQHIIRSEEELVSRRYKFLNSDEIEELKKLFLRLS